MESAQPLIGTTPLKARLSHIALAVWFCGIATLSAGALARHMVAFAAPQSDARLERHLRDLRPSVGWLAVHVLSSSCGCSARVAQHLLRDRRPAGWTDVVLWTGEQAPPIDLAERFDVRRVTTEELAAYGVEAVPLLIALSPSGETRYIGGYTDRKQGPSIRDVDILDAARSNAPIHKLPIFGCATSARLRATLSTLPGPEVL